VASLPMKPVAEFIKAMNRLLPMAMRVGTLSTYMSNGTKAKFPAPKNPIAIPVTNEYDAKGIVGTDTLSIG